MMKIRILLITFCLFCVSWGLAQNDPPLRIELPTAQDADDYHYTLLNKNGVMVFYEGEKINADTTEWVLMHYDTNLQKVNIFTIQQSVKAAFRQSYYGNGILYLLFQDVVGKKEIPLTYLSIIDINSATYNNFTLENIPSFEIAQLKAIDNNAVFSIIHNDSYYVYFYDANRRKLKDFIIRDAAIISQQFIEIDSLNEKFILGLGTLYPDKSALMAIYETTYQGELLHELPLPYAAGYFYNSVRYKIIDSSSAMLIGTYNLAKSKKSGFYHTGVFTMFCKNSHLSTPEFFNYTNLHRKKEGEEPQNEQPADLQLLIGDIVANDSCFTLVTEVYYPEYNYHSNYDNMSSYYYSSAYSPATTTFEGYRYVNAYVTCFDRSGNLLWDNYFPFTNILTRRLAKRVSVYYTPYGTVIFYPYNSTLTATLIDGYNVVENISSIPIESNYKKDAVDYSRDINMYNWYDNKFLICGYQHIINNSKGNRGKRYVFFINKLEYR